MNPSIWKCGLALILIGAPLQAQEQAASHDPRFFPSPQAQSDWASGLEKLLESEQSLSLAQRQYQIAKGKNPNDPRLDYAMGLVHLKHYEYDEAEQRFRAAIAPDGVHYLPAWQAKIHLDLLQKDRDKFLRDTLALAELIVKSDADWIGADQPKAAATSLGEVCEYLKLHGVDFLEPAQQDAHDVKLTETLTPELVAAWVEGQTRLRRKYVRLFNEVEQKKQDAKAEIRQTANREAAELKDRHQSIEQQQENSQKSAVEWKAWYDKQLKNTQSQLTRLQKDYAALDAAAKRLNAIIQKMQLELAQLQTVIPEDKKRRVLNVQFGVPTDLEKILAERQKELFQRQLEYAGLEQKALSLIVQARKILAVRQEAGIKYKNATGQIVRRDQTLDRWKRVVEKSSLKAAAKADNTNPLETLEKRLTLVSSYFPLDFEAEKTRMLKSYKLP